MDEAKDLLEEVDLVEPTPEEPEEPEETDYGVIGYVTLEEADRYVSDYYTSTDEFRVGWEALEKSDKAALLRKSFMTIELLPFAGRKTCPCQPNAFPRCPLKEVPEAIKLAQIEQALSSADSDENEDAKHYEKLWQWGVSSYTIGNLTEHISTGTYGAGALRTAGVTSATASRLLAPFIQGGYAIR